MPALVNVKCRFTRTDVDLHSSLSIDPAVVTRRSKHPLEIITDLKNREEAYRLTISRALH